MAKSICEVLGIKYPIIQGGMAWISDAKMAGIFFAGTPFVFLACVFVAALATANSFGMCMGLALDKVPEKANEITSLMVMAIVGGGIVTPVLGFVQSSSAGATGIVCVLLACLAYLFVLGLFAGRSSTKEHVAQK